MSIQLITRFKIVSLAVAFATSMAILAATADARPGGGGSFGSRGGRTFTAPPTTNTAPRTATPMERSMTQPGQASPTASTTAPASRFGGLRSLLMGGLIGAGLAAMFGLGGFAYVLGFLLQAALIGGLLWLAWSFFRSRYAQPALAGAAREPSRPNVNYRAATGGMGGGSAPALNIGPDDYQAFEQSLSEVQLAYGRGDTKTLAERSTPEMLSYFAQELDVNRKKGVRNEISQPKLLQGDLAEAWREPSGEYATVAMRYSIIDATVDTAGRTVAGNRVTPDEVTEIWTFRRPPNGTAQQWQLSAIQQTQ